mgnify:CR=1 FL=1
MLFNEISDFSQGHRAKIPQINSNITGLTGRFHVAMNMPIEVDSAFIEAVPFPDRVVEQDQSVVVYLDFGILLNRGPTLP